VGRGDSCEMSLGVCETPSRIGGDTCSVGIPAKCQALQFPPHVEHPWPPPPLVVLLKPPFWRRGVWKWAWEWGARCSCRSESLGMGPN
jgi:hypothetical protein